MVWSSSKDDDGLEPLDAASRADSSHASSSTVLVDPISQVPEAPHDPHAQLALSGMERTEVLRERKVDRLRAEVARHRRHHARRRRNRLMLWAAAGALSVVLGAGLAAVVAPRLFGPAPLEAAMPVEAAEPVEAAAPPETRVSLQAVPSGDARALEEGASRGAEPLPAIAPTQPTDELRGAELESEERPESDALTLDELPFE